MLLTKIPVKEGQRVKEDIRAKGTKPRRTERTGDMTTAGGSSTGWKIDVWVVAELAPGES